MEDQQINQNQEHNSSSTSPAAGSEKQETVRSRWTPKPEQILILESIFNSGMVNPPKDETIRIRKSLEKFGSVGDANVFYWFQNRRSRSRRRQRQIQASLAGGDHQRQQRQHQVISNTNLGLGEDLTYNGSSTGFNLSGMAAAGGGGDEFVFGSSSCGSYNGGDQGGSEVDHSMFAGSSTHHQMGLLDIDSSSFLCPSDPSSLHFQSGKLIRFTGYSDCQKGQCLYSDGYITVFINGIATEVPRGQIDMKAMFGENVMLVHSSGLVIPFNEFGFSLQSLHHGETYFLVSRTS